MSEAKPAPAGASEAAPKRGVPIWAQVIVWVVLLALLVVVALGLRRSQQGSVKVGDTIPDFSLKFFDGYTYQGKTEVKLSELRGKIVVINFWASWCKPCEQEAADLEASWKSYDPSGQVVFFGADYVDTEPEARGYLKKFNISYPNGPDLGTRISQMFRISGVPETYFIDQTGKLVYAQIGPFASESEVHAILDPLIKK
jgi:cytochrome c biogenesis protein CcmG, thiol:disulfide interchange protein DsbE